MDIVFDLVFKVGHELVEFGHISLSGLAHRLGFVGVEAVKNVNELVCFCALIPIAFLLEKLIILKENLFLLEEQIGSISHSKALQMQEEAVELNMIKLLKALLVEYSVKLTTEVLRLACLGSVLDETKLIKGEELHVVPDVFLQVYPYLLLKELDVLTKEQD